MVWKPMYNAWCVPSSIVWISMLKESYIQSSLIWKPTSKASYVPNDVVWTHIKGFMRSLLYDLKIFAQSFIRSKQHRLNTYAQGLLCSKMHYPWMVYLTFLVDVKLVRYFFLVLNLKVFHKFLRFLISRGISRNIHLYITYEPITISYMHHSKYHELIICSLKNSRNILDLG